MLDDVTALAEDAERSIKWEQDCKAFLEQVIAATVSCILWQSRCTLERLTMSLHSKGGAKLASTPGPAIIS